MQGEQIEGVARVVAEDGGMVWLEPEPTGSCGGCMSAAICGHKSGSTSRRLAARRFALPNEYGLRPGDRVVVGIAHGSVLRSALRIYGLPLGLMLAGALIAQAIAPGDASAVAGMLVGGLAGGLVARGGRAARPVVLRREDDKRIHMRKG